MEKTVKILMEPISTTKLVLRSYNGSPIKNNSGVLQASESALSDLQSGKSDAFLSGPWSKMT